MDLSIVSNDEEIKLLVSQLKEAFRIRQLLTESETVPLEYSDILREHFECSIKPQEFL